MTARIGDGKLSEEPNQAPLPVSEPSPQPAVQPPKHRRNKNIISIILIIVILGSALGALGYLYLDLSNKYENLQREHTRLHSDYNQLNTDYIDLNALYYNLTIEHIDLKRNQSILKTQYDDLNSNYSTLDTRYDNLNTQYQSLSNSYDALLNNYDELSHAFNNPLPYRVVPSTDELRQWLATDSTDAIGYSMPSFICGDFSVMLSQHAKLKNWDMGIVGIGGYNKYTYESYSHALNIIYTQEGLVYVEPQNDHVWWYDGHQEIYSGITWEIDGEWITVTDYQMVVWA